MRVQSLLAAVVLTALPLLSACEAGEEGEVEAEDSRIELASVNRSGVTGTVTADHSDDEVTITLALSGLRPGEVYPAHVHGGRCAAGGPVEVPLGRVTARDDGRASLTTRIDASSAVVDNPAFVQVHAPDGSAVACGDLPGHDDGPRLTERAPDADEAPAGDTAGRPGTRSDTTRPDTAGAGPGAGATPR